MFTRSKKAHSISESKIDTKIDIVHAPRLWPVVLILSALLWIIATTGGRDVFVKETLGEAFDSQAEHFLRGDVDVDGGAIRWEAMIVNGHARMYFGPFPALLRMPLNAIYPEGRGAWSRLSGFLAAELALIAFAGLISDALSVSGLSPRWRGWLGSACLVAFVFATPLLFLLGNMSIYSEAIIWAFAWSISAIYFAWRSPIAEGRQLILSLLGFSISAGFALLARVTFGIPLLLIAPLLALRFVRVKNFRALLPLFLPLLAAAGFYVCLSYARFGNFTGVNFDTYVNPTHREVAHRYGIFRLDRFPYSFCDYFGLRIPPLQSRPPFFQADRRFGNFPPSFSLPFSETYISATWSSAWLIAGAILGVICLFRKNGRDLFQIGAAAAFALQSLLILCYFVLAQRYSLDLYPFLIFCTAIFLRQSGKNLPGAHWIVAALIPLSIFVNFFATASWLQHDGSLPTQTRMFWSAISGGRVSIPAADKP
jgi:hypothetical protein